MIGRGRVAVLACLGVALAMVGGCSWFHRGADKCREPAMPANLVNGAGLQVPAGLDAPDPRGAVRVPELSEPEPPRSRRDPCLSMPPAYKTASP
jgi:hypothetical protein